MALTFILNPAAAHGRAGRLRSRLESIAGRLGVAYIVLLTREPGHATELAREAAGEGQTVVAVGGDGTIQEVAAGIVNSAASLGVVPIGTGNDYARSLGLPTKLDESVRMLPFLRPQLTDLGRVTWTDAAGKEHARIFVNAFGVGFDARVAVLSDQFKRLPGQAAYLAGVFKGLRTWANPLVDIWTTPTVVAPATAAEADAPEAAPALAAAPPPNAIVPAIDETPSANDAGGTVSDSQPPLKATPPWFSGPLFLLAVGNGYSVGGGFRITPDAVPDDGHLDLCLLRGITAGRALQLLPRAMRGNHTTAPEVTICRVASATLQSETPLPVHADGEILTTTAVRLTATIEPGALQVLRP